MQENDSSKYGDEILEIFPLSEKSDEVNARVQIEGQVSSSKVRKKLTNITANYLIPK